jgi:hypothetical protein
VTGLGSPCLRGSIFRIWHSWLSHCNGGSVLTSACLVWPFLFTGHWNCAQHFSLQFCCIGTTSCVVPVFLLDFPLHRYTGGALSAVTECPLMPRALCGFDGPIRREHWMIAMASASGSADGPDLKNRFVASRFIGGLARSLVLSDGDFFVCDFRISVREWRLLFACRTARWRELVAVDWRKLFLPSRRTIFACTTCWLVLRGI